MKIKTKIKSILLALGFIIILNFLYPSPFPEKFSLPVGSVAPRDIIAPHSFYIKKSKKEMEAEQKKAKESVFSVLRYNEEVPYIVKKRIKEFFDTLEIIRKAKKPLIQKRADLISIISLEKKELNYLLRKDYSLLKDSVVKVIDEIFSQGIIDSTNKICSPVVVLLGEERPRSIKEFLNLSTLTQFLRKRATYISPHNTVEANIFVTLITSFIEPNLTIDWSETLRRQEKAASQVSPIKGEVQKGEMIVRAHDIVTPQVVEKLNVLSQEVGIAGTPPFIGRNVIYLIAVLTLFLYLHFFSSSIFGDFGKLILLVLLMLIIMGISSAIILMKLSWYLIPIALFGVLASLLLGTQTALGGVIALTILISVYSGGGFEALVLFLVSGISAVFVSSIVKKPSDFLMPVLCISGVYICVALGIELTKLSPFPSLLKSLGYAAVGGMGASFVGFGLLPFFERMFKITTPITLLEYANPDHPLLRNLATYAPGTYHHSMTVATLAEGGARTVGVNSLLARVGAYYHDIGKLKKPDYFIENQKENEPRPKLTPELNARVIISHVREGVEIGDKENLPREIVNIIREHHGTTVVESLYLKAKEGGQDVDEIDFRYPGPLPRSKESAIVMLADTMEAAVRSLSSPSPSKIKGIVENMTEKKLKDGQFSMTNLSIEEIRKIKDSFIPILISIFHQRIAYDKNLYKNFKKESQNK